MILTSRRRQELEKLVDNFTSQNNIDISGDIFKELNKIGFVIHNAKFKKPLSGMILVNENIDKFDGFSSNKIIIYNTDQNLYEIRFVLAHELAHYIDKKINANGEKILLAARDHTDRYSDNVDEQEKDYMAAALLMPREDLKRSIESYLKKEFDDLTKTDIDKLKADEYFIQMLQKSYRVQETLARRRIEEITEGGDH